MMAHSHILFGVASWWGYCAATGHPATAAASALAGVGALLPDLDHPQSALGRRVPFVSVPLARLVGHRGVTHSLLATLAVAAALWRWSGQGADVIAPLCVGYLSHLGGDMLTPSGVPLLWPARRSFSLNLFRTGSPWETLVVGVLTVIMLHLTPATPGLLAETQHGVGVILREGPEALSALSRQ